MRQDLVNISKDINKKDQTEKLQDQLAFDAMEQENKKKSQMLKEMNQNNKGLENNLQKVEKNNINLNNEISELKIQLERLEDDKNTFESSLTN